MKFDIKFSNSKNIFGKILENKILSHSIATIRRVDTILSTFASFDYRKKEQITVGQIKSSYSSYLLMITVLNNIVINTAIILNYSGDVAKSLNSTKLIQWAVLSTLRKSSRPTSLV